MLAILPIDGRRYGTAQMVSLFDEQSKVDYQLRIEGAAAIAQGEIGMIPASAGRDIHRVANSGRITARRTKQLEAKSDHDTAALVEALSERCKESSRPWVHFGLTSNDLVDTSNAMQMHDALRIIRPRVAGLAKTLAAMAVKYKRLPAVGRTHGQHASIIPFGLKFANWASEMAAHLDRLDGVARRVLVCKTLGVVGTGSLMGSGAVRVQARVAKRLGLYPVQVATQVVARERYAEYVFGLALIGSTLEKIAVEVRNLQRTEIGEVAELFRKGQMGSSAVPVKRNPIKSERVSSLARIMRSQIGPALENIPLWHERDLSNSANERFLLPTSAILADEMLHTTAAVVDGLFVNKDRIAANLRVTGGQIFAEFVLKALIGKGVPRFVAYRDVQRVAFEALESGQDYMEAVIGDGAISSHLTQREIRAVFVSENHLGAAPGIIDGVYRTVQRACRRAAAFPPLPTNPPPRRRSPSPRPGRR